MTDPTSAEARLAALERRITTQARLLRILAVTATVAVGGLLAGAKRAPGPVVGSAFVLVDAAGKTRGQLALTEEGQASLLLTTASGHADVGFVLSPSGASALRLRSPKRNVTLEAADDGRAELRIRQAHAKTTAVLGIDAAGRPSVVLNDKTGKVVFDSQRK